ncbi:carboxylesterase/lipase family protein [Nocardia sp. NPDC058176]|uniref:carboxylesterase/lipase family protein n=1 Tax=Nocardia sp. NPDC058176 TaxID=3346368 RepID=UPI0036DC7175
MTTVDTEYGKVRGTRVDGLHLFRDIPYAAPPFGALRFRPPRPPQPWTGVRDATQPGPGAPQPADESALGTIYNPAVTGEDCLTLEIWTPDPGGAGLPVLVHIHGGGYMYGTGSAPLYSGRSFARDGVVHVGINYRLGIEGFLYLGEGTDNLGLRDQTAALAWVGRNIAAFGGDPERVTLIGLSGGGVSVFNHLAMPDSRGLFAGAIAQSASPAASVDTAEALRFTRQVARSLRVEPTVEAMAQVPIARTVAATRAAAKRFALGLLRFDRRPLMLSPFRTVHDTDTVPVSALDGIARGAHRSQVPLLTGTVANEVAGFLEAVDALRPLRPLIHRGIRHGLRLDRSLIQGYRDGPRHLRDTSAMLEAAWSDWLFRVPTIRFAESRDAPTWLYEFRWQAETRAPRRGAVHGLDAAFVWDNLDVVGAVGDEGIQQVGTNPPQELADLMHAAWVRFAHTGTPGWPRYTEPDRPTMVFDTVSGVESDPAGPERRLWEGRVLRSE